MAEISTCSTFTVERSPEGQGHEMMLWCPDANSLNCNMSDIDHFRHSPNGSRNNKEWVKRHIYNIADITGISSKDHAQIDQNTYRWKSWVGQVPSPSTDPGTKPATQTDPTLYKLTQVEFKRLSEQVKEVNSSIQNKFKTNGLKKYIGTQSSGGVNSPTRYHSQLATSQKAFNAKQWMPYEQQDLQENTAIRCRHMKPAEGRPCSRQTDSRPPSRPSTALSCRSISSRPSTAGFRPRPPTQPRATQTVPTRTQSASDLRVETGNYDTLTPDIMYQLSDKKEVQSFYGDKSLSYQDLKEIENEKKNINDNEANSTSGIGTDRDSDLEAESDEEITVYKEAEQMLEKAAQIPMVKLEIRPEKMDSVYVPPDRKDQRRFDFDAGNIDIPVYEFVSPLSKDMRSVDLKAACLKELDWREVTKKRPETEDESAILDRLQAIQKLQIQTEEMEEKKTKRVKSAKNKQRVTNGVINRLYTGMVAPAKGRDKKCCADCVQSACVGDCPTKKTPETCPYCDQKCCDGDCSVTPYDPHERGAVVELDGEFDEAMEPRPRSGCSPCSHRHTAKLINVNNVVLGRPRSSYATYNRGVSSAKPKDLRPQSCTPALEYEIGRLDIGLEAETSLSRPSTASSTGRKRRLYGRAAMIPGKSYFSQRRDSITNNNGASTRPGRRKAKSARARRTPTTTV